MKRLLRLSKSSRTAFRQASSDRSTAVRSEDALKNSRQASSSLPGSGSSSSSTTTTTNRTRLRRRVVPFHPQSSTLLDIDGIPQQQLQKQQQPLPPPPQPQKFPSSEWTVPLTLADYHLRHEQLPFCFLFRETLDATELERSLQRVLQHFPILAGHLSANQLSIQSRVSATTDNNNNNDDDDDHHHHQGFVPFCIADHNGSLHDWLAASPQNHSHTSGGGHPDLLDVFDGLFDAASSDASGIDPLVTIRITYFACGGTALGVNWSHALGDTASLLRVVACWGRDYQKQSYNGAVCHVRANAACAGMSHHFADALWIDNESPSSSHETPVNEKEGTPSFASQCLEYLFLNETPEQVTISNTSTPTIPHQYVHLPFPTAVLDAMKAYGMSIASQPTEDPSHQPYVSTNDMLTSFGWLMKRALSGQSEHGISMVVNLRGRCGVAAFGDIRSLALSRDVPSGLLGNAIINVVAHFPPTSADFGMACTAQAASAIRHALAEQLAQVPHRIAQSRHGRPVPAVSSFGSFATTSWSQFCLQDIQFGTERMVGFHGHPSHPLPVGSTFASVIGPAWPGQEGGCTYQLLLPSPQVAEAQRIHAQLSQAFLQWHRSDPS